MSGRKRMRVVSKRRTVKGVEVVERGVEEPHPELETIVAQHYRHWQGGRVVRSTPHYAATGKLPEPWDWWSGQHAEAGQ